MTTVKAQAKDFIARAPLELHIPRAQDWYKGMQIKDNNGDVLFHVFGSYNYGTDLNPRFLAILADYKHKEILALVRGIYSEVFTCFPSYDGQHPSIHLENLGRWTGGEVVIDQDMFLYAHKVGNRLKRCTGPKQEELQAKGKSIGGKCFCKGTTRQQVTFEKLDGGIVLIRDQREETLSIPAGENILVSVGLAYAIDRNIKCLGSSLETSERVKSAQTALGGGGGLLGAAIAVAIDVKRQRPKKNEVRIVELKNK